MHAMVLPANTPLSVFYAQLGSSAPAFDAQTVQSINVSSSNSSIVRTNAFGALVDGGVVHAQSAIQVSGGRECSGC